MTTEAEAKAAFLDALAVGESEGLAKAENISPYFILYGGGSFEKLPRTAYGFPIWNGKDNSHAAGRYQFEPRTYFDQAAKLGISDFGPASQDLAAWDLAATVYKRVTRVDLLSDLQAGTLNLVAGALRSTWTSLDPATFPGRYRAALVARAVGVIADAPITDPPYLAAVLALEGPERKLIQKALGVKQDAIVGPITRAALEANRKG